MTDPYQRAGDRRERLRTAGEAVAAVRHDVEERRARLIAGLLELRCAAADAAIGKSKDAIARTKAALASAQTEIAFLADVAIGLKVREAEAQLAALDVEIAAVERDVERLEKARNAHAPEIAKVRDDLIEIRRRINNQTVPESELLQEQADLQRAERELDQNFVSPVRYMSAELKPLALQRPALECAVAAAKADASELESDADDRDPAPVRDRAPLPSAIRPNLRERRRA